MSICLCAARFLGVSHKGLALGVGALVCVAIDAGDRWTNGRSTNRNMDLISPASGGHAFFVPMWCWGVIALLGSLFSRPR